MAEDNNSALLADIYKWKNRAREVKAQLDALTKERDALSAGITKITRERDDALEAAKVATQGQTPDDKDRTIAGLKRDIWTRDTRSKFDKAARGANVRDDALDDLWSLLGIDPEKDTGIDDEALTGRLAEAVKARPYLLQPAPEMGGGAAVAAKGSITGTANTPAVPARPPGPGLGRGAPEGAPIPDTRAALLAKHGIDGTANPFRIA